MIGFCLDNSKKVNDDKFYGFQRETSLNIGRYSLFFSAENSVHNFNTFASDETPFVFIYGEISNCDYFGHDRLNEDFVKYISLRIKKFEIKCVSLLKGLFSILVYDIKKDIIWIYTDNIGGFCTPYYRFSDGLFRCSSSFKVLANSPEPLCVDPQSLSRLISTGYVLPACTLAEGVRKLRPGCLMSVTTEGFQEDQISVLSFEASRKLEGLETGEELILSYMEKFMTKDSCFLLSGGLDSSTLVSIASKRLNRKIICCTGVFSEFNDIDESFYAKIVAKYFSSDLICFELGGYDVFQSLPEVVECIGEPFLDDSILPTYALLKKIKTRFDTVFSGDGPDHIFNRYYSLAVKRTLGILLKNISFFSNKNKHIDRLLRSASEDIEFAYSEIFALPYWGHNSRLSMLELLSSDLRHPFESSYIRMMCNYNNNSLNHRKNMEIINFVDFYIDGSFGVFSKVGKAASALGLHIREPYLASSYAEFAASLPMNEKIRGGFFSQTLSRCTTKVHLRESISKKYLPDAIINRKKGGFTPPLKCWLQEFLRNEQVLKRFSDVSKASLDMEFVEEIFCKFLNKNTYGGLIFMLISFDLWVKIFVEKRSMKGVQLKDVYS
jgi:asparagine synthase (glutamine-hydrolysing)